MKPHATCLRVALAAVAALAGGCAATHQQIQSLPDIPKELNKVALPDYIIEPPDVIQLDLLNAIPKPPYRIQPLDALAIRVPEAFPDSPIAGVYPVDPDGTVNFGGSYGSVPVAGLTLEEAREAIEKHLSKTVKKATADISLAQGRAVQQVRGPHLVRPDGKVGLGNYGSVRVVGMTVPEAKRAIEEHLAQYFQAPEVSVDVSGFNSKVYYIVYDGGGSGTQVIRVPVTGNETVLDAVGQVGGTSAIGDTRRMWVARPAPDGCTQVLPVDWAAITECGDVRTNYQILPGDRVFVKAYPFVTADTRLARLLTPFERLFGFTLLGAGTVRTLQFRSNNNSNGTGIFQ